MYNVSWWEYRESQEDRWNYILPALYPDRYDGHNEDVIRGEYRGTTTKEHDGNFLIDFAAFFVQASPPYYDASRRIAPKSLVL